MCELECWLAGMYKLFGALLLSHAWVLYIIILLKKLFSNLYLLKFLDTAKSEFFPWGKWRSYNMSKNYLDIRIHQQCQNYLDQLDVKSFNGELTRPIELKD